MKVTTITPIYNNADYLEECVNSLLGQTYEQVEHIFVDDGSADRSKAILLKYANDPRCKMVFKEKNEGIAAAYRDALRIATGDILCFLDADDIADADRVSLTVKAFMENPQIDIVYSSIEFIDREGGSFGLLGELPSYVKNERLFFQLFRRNFFTGSALSVRNHAWIDFSLDVICCDYDVCLQIADRGGKFAYIDKPLTKYRIHGSNTSNQGEKMLRSLNQILDRYSMSDLLNRWKAAGCTEAEMFTTFGIMEFYYRKNKPKALEFFEKAVQFGSNEPEAYFYLGCIEFERAMLKEASEWFEKANQVKPGVFQVMNNAAVTNFLITGNREPSLALLEEARAIQPHYMLIEKNIRCLLEHRPQDMKIIPVLADTDLVYMTYCKLHV